MIKLRHRLLHVASLAEAAMIKLRHRSLHVALMAPDHAAAVALPVMVLMVLD